MHNPVIFFTTPSALKGFASDDFRKELSNNPDSTTSGGVAFVIPLDQAVGKISHVEPWTKEMQYDLAEFIRDSVLINYPDPKKTPQIILLSENDTLPVFYNTYGYIRPLPGVNLVLNHGSNYGITYFDYTSGTDINRDYNIDGTFIYIDEEYRIRSSSTKQECESIQNPGDVDRDTYTYPDDQYLKSLFEKDGHLRFFSQYEDKTFRYDVLMNISKKFAKEFEWNGRRFIKISYMPGMRLDNVLGIR